MDEDVGGLGRPIARPPYGAGHPLDKRVGLPQLLELLRRQLQPRTLDQNGEALRRNRFGHADRHPLLCAAQPPQDEGWAKLGF
jgi:hypothetical protein